MDSSGEIASIKKIIKGSSAARLTLQLTKRAANATVDPRIACTIARIMAGGTADSWGLFGDDSSSSDSDSAGEAPVPTCTAALPLPQDALSLVVVFLTPAECATFECSSRSAVVALELVCSEFSRLARRSGESWSALLAFVRQRGARTRRLALGHELGAAIDHDGVLWLCGSAPWALGLGLISATGTPQPLRAALLGGATRCRSVAIGHRHVVVATHAGVVYTFGSASHGQLGRAIHADEPNTPFLDGAGRAVRSACVEPLRAERIVAVAAGACHSLALTSTGALYSWGHDALGQCGVRAALVEAEDVDGLDDGEPNPFRVRHPYIRLLPVEVRQTGRGERAPRIARIGASQSASAAVAATGRLYVAGTRGFSRAERDSARCSARAGLWPVRRSDDCTFAAGDMTAPPRMLRVRRTAAIVSVSSGASASFVLALDADGACWSCGSNECGQLGVGRVDAKRTASPERGVFASVVFADAPTTRIVDVATGEAHALAVDCDGALWAWGDNSRAQCGARADSSSGVISAAICLPRCLALLARGPAASEDAGRSEASEGTAESAYRAVEVAAGDSSSMCRAVQLSDGEESTWAWGDDGDSESCSGLGFGAPALSSDGARVQSHPRRHAR